MNLHEYQGKSILASYGVGIEEVIDSVDQAEAAKKLTEETAQVGTLLKLKSMLEEEVKV